MILHDGFSSFAKDNGKDKIFTYWVYRQVYTPYEEKQCFSDESIYEDTCGSFGSTGTN